MASNQRTVDFLLDQLSEAGGVTAKKMFGEYGLFLQGKMIALICDDRLFFKPTEPGRKLFTTVTEGIPYPGAKPCLQVSEEDWDNREWLGAVAKATCEALPVPRKKPAKA
jgi:TfoX/Sxy family transcriptional regulator of competence genes